MANAIAKKAIMLEMDGLLADSIMMVRHHDLHLMQHVLT